MANTDINLKLEHQEEHASYLLHAENAYGNTIVSLTERPTGGLGPRTISISKALLDKLNVLYSVCYTLEKLGVSEKA